MAVPFPDTAEAFRRKPVTLIGFLVITFATWIYLSCEYKHGGDWSTERILNEIGNQSAFFFIAFFVVAMLEIWAGRIVDAVATKVAERMGDTDPKMEVLASEGKPLVSGEVSA